MQKAFDDIEALFVVIWVNEPTPRDTYLQLEQPQ